MRSFDLTLFGATGFTGGLVAAYLARTVAEGLRWAIAGRDRARLEAVAAALPDAGRPAVVVADTADPASLRALAESTRVLCSTVGPYARLGPPVVAACVAAGTDYLDLTGEPQFIARMIAAHHEEARANGVRVVHCCGFDSIPSDLGALLAHDRAVARFGRAPDRIRMYVRSVRGGFSGGTLASLGELLAEARADRAVRRLLADPYALGGEGPPVDDTAGPAWDPVVARWTAPFLMAPVNARVVRRTSALAGWGPVDYTERMAVGRGPVGMATAFAVSAGLGASTLALATPPVKRLVTPWLPKPSEGPDAAARAAGSFVIDVVALVGEERETVRVTGDQDPGYGATSGMLAEAAIHLAKTPAGPHVGVVTPAVALGEAVLPGLARAGVRFEPTV